jgi:hypothetical protein
MTFVSAHIFEKDTGIGLIICRGDPNVLGLIRPVGCLAIDATGPALYQSASSTLSSWTLQGTEGVGGGGGGAGAYSYLGYNTVGASSEVATNHRVYMKKITVPSNGILLNVAAHIQNDSADHVQQVGVAVFSDNSGSPLRLLAAALNPDASTLLESAASTPVARWLAIPINLEVVAGDYWIAVMIAHASNPGSIDYDASGTDRYYTSGGVWFADAGFYTVTTGTRNYSIRGAFLPTA